jgi:hypothetical protein
VKSFPVALSAISSKAASMNRCTRPSARARAESSDRATASSAAESLVVTA